MVERAGSRVPRYGRSLVTRRNCCALVKRGCSLSRETGPLRRQGSGWRSGPASLASQPFSSPSSCDDPPTRIGMPGASALLRTVGARPLRAHHVRHRMRRAGCYAARAGSGDPRPRRCDVAKVRAESGGGRRVGYQLPPAAARGLPMVVHEQDAQHLVTGRHGRDSARRPRESVGQPRPSSEGQQVLQQAPPRQLREPLAGSGPGASPGGPTSAASRHRCTLSTTTSRAIVGRRPEPATTPSSGVVRRLASGSRPVGDSPGLAQPSHLWAAEGASGRGGIRTHEGA
jgi:hypothetical protein